MVKKVIDTIKKNSLLEKNESVVVALSGGADSTALLLILTELGYNVSAIHINHLIRGDEAERDVEFCVKLCEKLGVLLRVEKVNIPEISNKIKKGLEETARIERYRIFSEYDCKVATAHNADDNAETVLFHLIRGSGLKGFCGIPIKRDNIIRPLLYSSRKEIVSFLQHRNQDFVNDSTNFQNDYTRNKIRNEIIPIIREINPNFTSSVEKSVKSIQLDEGYLEDCVSNFRGNFENIPVADIPGKELKKLPTPIRHRIIRLFLEEMGENVNYGKIQDVDNILQKTSKLKIPEGMVANIPLTDKGI
jgi:tRNA(Ile)-lysidine synthase